MASLIVLRSLVTLLSIAFLACSGGGPTTGGGSGESLAPKTEQLTDAERRHFLDRTCFGASPRDLARLESLGLAEFVEDMLTFRDEPEVERDALAEMADPAHPHVSEVTRWWLHLMLHTEQPFRERLAMFWHDRFATSHVNMSNGQRWWIVEHIKMLRDQSLGNYRRFLEELSVDPAMLFWLDGYKSTKDAPNENYAREFWELFTLGVDNGYTQTEIEQASRAFTGWRMRLDATRGQWIMVFEVDRYDTRNKTVFGKTGRWRPDDIVRLTLDERPAAEAICKALFEAFCFDAPEQAITAALAEELRANDYELRPTLKRILMSRAMFSARAREPRVRSPLELLIGFARTTGMGAPTTVFARELERLGHQPSMPPGVNGWPVGEEWLSAGAMLARYNAIHEIVTARDWQRTRGFRLDSLVPQPERDASGVVSTLADLLGVELSTADVDRYRQLLEQKPTFPGGRLQLEYSAFDWSNSRHRDERVRGLLIALAQHPAYQAK